MNRRGFTLLEVLVATLIMGIAVVGLLSAISASLRNAARLTSYDQVALLARTRMDALLLDHGLPKASLMEGNFQNELPGVDAGWRARLTVFETLPKPTPGTPAIERLELEVWWMSGSRQRTFTLEGFRRTLLRAEDIAGGGPAPQ